MPLGTEVGLSLGHIVLDGDPVTPWEGAQQPPPLSQFTDAGFHAGKGLRVRMNSGLCLLWPNSWIDQDATWYGGIGLGPGDIVGLLDWTQPSIYCINVE